MKLPQIFHSKIFLLIALIAFLGTAGLEYKQWRTRNSIDKEILALKAEEQNLFQANQELENSINFLSTPEYQDKLARLQLNLKKEGEIVVNFPPQIAKQSTGPENDSSKNNPTKWWEYIFLN